MYRILLSVLLLIPLSDSIAQNDNAGSGHALRFDGVDDYVDLGNTYHDVNLPFTISAWVYLDPSLSSAVPIFTTNDNTNFIYRGFWFSMSETGLLCEYGDGTGGNSPAFRRGKVANIQNGKGRWLHVCAVMKSAFDISLYVNGVNVGGSSTGDSNLPMASSFPDDTPKIGSQYSNTTAYKFKGQIDEVRLWSRALTQTEVQTAMCKKLTGSESGLIGYWTFNETVGGTVYDKSTRGANGQLMNNPERVYSGAPIGDESVYTYQTSWSAVQLSISDGSDMVQASDILGSPNGIHLYVVKEKPSQTGGLDLSTSLKPYFGAFVAASDVGNTFDLTYASCGLFSRTDNSNPSWASKTSPIQNHPDRIEVIKDLSQAELEINLGADEAFCPFTSRTLSPVIDPTGYTFTWQNGSTQPTFQANDFGTYWVSVIKGCVEDVDTITFTKTTSEFTFDMGADEVICPFVSKVLRPLENPTGFEFTWQDGSKQSTFQPSGYGKYWVKVQSGCLAGSDTITISKLELEEPFIPNVFTPNGDDFNQYFMIDEDLLGSKLVVYNVWGKKVFESINYQNNWDGEGLPSGTYYYYLISECIQPKKGWLSIIH